MTRVRAALWHLHETGLCTSTALRRLLEAESIQLDNDEDCELNEWEFLEPFAQTPDWIPLGLFDKPVSLDSTTAFKFFGGSQPYCFSYYHSSLAIAILAITI